MRNRTKARSAFTLIEVVTSLAIMSVLMLGLSGAIMIGAHAIPANDDIGQADQQVVEVLNLMRADLRESEMIRLRTSPSFVVFRLFVIDSGAEGTQKIIDYSYTISTGVLVRKVDNLPTETLLTDIKQYDLSIDEQAGEYVGFNLVMNVPTTVQGTFDIHAALPVKPKVN